MRFLLTYIFSFTAIFGFSQDVLLGKYYNSTDNATLLLKSDSTYNFRRPACLSITEKWFIKEDKLYLYDFQIDPVSFEYTSVKIYTDSLIISKKKNTIYLDYCISINKKPTFKKTKKPDLVYVRAIVSGFMDQCFGTNRLDFIIVHNCNSKDLQYDVKSFKIEFLRDDKKYIKVVSKAKKYHKM